MAEQLLPAFYINVTSRCNMHCEYCPPGGEDITDDSRLTSIELLTWIVEAATYTPLKTYRITGGEPMLYPKRVYRILTLLNEREVSEVILNTNGYNLERHAERLANFRLKKLKVSLDSLDAKTFRDITGTNLLRRVLKGIDAACSANLPLEVNTVLYKHTLGGLNEILEYCITNDISLKLLDLWLYDNCPGASRSSGLEWSQLRLDLRDLTPSLIERFGQPKRVDLSGKRGIPMLQFRIGKSATLTLTDSSAGTSFAEVCRGCALFPCQLGLFNLSLSSTGSLSPCRLRSDLSKPLKGFQKDAILSQFSEMLRYYQNPFFVKKDEFSPVHKRLI